MTAGADLRLLRAAVFTAVCVTLSAAGHSLTGGNRTPFWSVAVACAAVFVVAAPLAGRERSLPGIAGLLAAGQVGLHTLFSCRPAGTTASAAGSATSSHGAHGGSGADVRSLAAQLLCGEQSAGRLSESEARRIISDAGLDADRLGGSGSAGLSHQAAQHATHHSAGHGGGGAAVSAGETPLECLHNAARAALSSFDVPMLLGHLLAALVLGWLLRRGETALWRLVRLSARSARTAVARVRALRTALAYVRSPRDGLLPGLPAHVCFDGAGDQAPPRSVLLDHSVHRRGPPRRERQKNLTLAA